MDKIIFLDVLPKELIFIVLTYIGRMKDRKSISQSSEFMKNCIICYNKDISKGIINPFLSKGIDINLCSINDTSKEDYERRIWFHNPMGDEVISLKNLMRISQLCDFKNIKRVFFVFIIREIFYVTHHNCLFTGVIIHNNLNNQFVCNIKLYDTIEIFSGDSWIQMWKQLSAEHIHFMTRFKNEQI